MNAQFEQINYAMNESKTKERELTQQALIDKSLINELKLQIEAKTPSPETERGNNDREVLN